VTEHILLAWLASAVVAGTPLIFASVGEIVAERSGVFNLGVEGMMLVGAVSGFIAAVHSRDLAMAVVVAMGSGAAVALLLAVLTITFGTDQAVTGLTLTLFGAGLSSFLGKAYIGVPSPATFHPVALPGLARLPFVGAIFFQQDLLVYASYALVPLVWAVLSHTRAGLSLRAAGEDAATADALGLNVAAIRYTGVLVGGALAGLAGAYLSLAYTPAWTDNMTGGQGWIAIALVIFSTWNPLRAAAGAYLFGGVDALGFRIQAVGGTTPTYFLRMLPYVFTLAVLLLVTMRSRRSGMPGNLGRPYFREERYG
jgi:general nucleoside transport system permease protein